MTELKTADKTAGLKTGNKLEFNCELKKLAIFLVIVAIGWLMPALGSITTIGVRVLFVFIAIVYGWSASSEIWPSLLAVLLLPFTGAITFPQLIGSGWGTDVGLFMIMLFVLLRFLEEQGVSQYLTAWLLSRRFLQGHPWRFLFMLFLAAYLVASLIHIFVGVYLVWGIVYSLVNALGYKPFDKFPTVLIFGVVLMGALSLSAMPWGANSIVLLAFFTNMLGNGVDIGKYLIYTLPLGLVSIMTYLLMCKFIFRLDVSALKNMDGDFINTEDLKLTTAKKIALGALAAFIIILLTPTLLPKTWAVTESLSSMGYTGKIIPIFVVLAMIRVDHKPIFSFVQLAAKGVNWRMMGILIVVLPLGVCLNNEATGLAAFLSQSLLPIFNGMSPLAFLVGITVVTIVLTNFLANMPVAMLLMPVAVNGAASYGINPEQIGYLLIVACTLAWMTPAASPAGMLLFSNKEWLCPKDIFKFGIPTMICIAIIILLVNYFWLGLFY
ncbi:MAG: SLC13 family permease [Peptococcaceae bacterium]